jgi:hypothetical protein
MRTYVTIPARQFGGPAIVPKGSGPSISFGGVLQSGVQGGASAGLAGAIIGVGSNLITGIFGGRDKVATTTFLREQFRQMLSNGIPGGVGTGPYGEPTLTAGYTVADVRAMVNAVDSQLDAIYHGDDQEDLNQAFAAFQYKTSVSSSDYVIFSFNTVTSYQPGGAPGGIPVGNGTEPGGELPGGPIYAGGNGSQNGLLLLGLGLAAVLVAAR